MPRRQLEDLPERSLRIWHPQKCEKVGQGGRFELRLSDQGEQGLELRGERQPASAACVVKGLHPETITRQEEAFVPIVPDRERENAIQPLQHRRSINNEHPQQNLGVALRVKSLAAKLEFVTELAEVVELSVVRHPPAVGVAHWLRARRRGIDDRKSPVAKTGRQGAVEQLDPCSVGPAVRHRLGHCGELKL